MHNEIVYCRHGQIFSDMSLQWWYLNHQSSYVLNSVAFKTNIVKYIIVNYQLCQYGSFAIDKKYYIFMSAPEYDKRANDFDMANLTLAFTRDLYRWAIYSHFQK